MPSTPPTARPLSADPSGARARVIAPPTLVWLLLGLVLASTIVSALLLWRLHTTGALTFVFLGWNLFLAWLPLVVALMMVGAHHGGLGGGWLLTLGLPWLLLLPNAPYIITDLIHLRPRHDSPLWFDAVLIIGFAVVGLMLGLVSLLLVHRITTAHVGRAGGWLLVVLVLGLSVMGIQLGRVHRFNSWDVLTNPQPLLDVVWYRLRPPLGDLELLQLCAMATAGLMLAYLAVWATARAAAPPSTRAAEPVR